MPSSWTDDPLDFDSYDFELDIVDEPVTEEVTDNECLRSAQIYLANLGYKIGEYNVYNEVLHESLVKFMQFQLGYYGAGCGLTGKLNSDTMDKARRFLPLDKKSPRIFLVKAVQLALLCAGYDINDNNEVNGIFSPSLSLAVKKFQLDNDIVESGKVDSETFIALF